MAPQLVVVVLIARMPLRPHKILKRKHQDPSNDNQRLSTIALASIGMRISIMVDARISTAFRETDCCYLDREQAANAACPREIPPSLAGTRWFMIRRMAERSCSWLEIDSNSNSF